jgi:hypothetical protein
MVAVETKKFTANLVATRQEIVNPGVSYRLTPSQENFGAATARTSGVRVLEVRWKSFCPHENLPGARLVRKLWRARGKALDRMCMKAREIFFASCEAHLSAVTRGNPLHTSRKNSAPGGTRRRFPPIHNGHHNNKGQNFVFNM